MDAKWEKRKAAIIASVDTYHFDPDAVDSIPALKVAAYDKENPMDRFKIPFLNGGPFDSIPEMKKEFELRKDAASEDMQGAFSNNPKELVAQRIRMEMDDYNDFVEMGGELLVEG